MIYFNPKLFVYFCLKEEKDKELYVFLGTHLAYRSLWKMIEVKKIWWKFYKTVGKPFEEWNTRFQGAKR